jgi:hypothetical protein
MSSHRQFRRRTIRRVAIGFALAAIVAPSAQAMGAGGHPFGGNATAEESSAVVPAVGQPYGELAQFPGAGLAAASGYGELHQFPGAGLGPTPIDIRNVRPTILGGPSRLPQHSVDGPRTAPDAVVNPAEPVTYGNRGRWVPGAHPLAATSSDSVDVGWPASGIGIAIAVGALAALAGALVFGGSRRRGTLQGA